MNEKKLRMAWIGTLVGAFVLIVAMVLVWKFRFYDDVVSQLASTETKYTTEKGNADKLAPTLKATLLAQQRLLLAKGELDYFRTRYRSLPIDLTQSAISGQGPRNATYTRYLNEYASGLVWKRAVNSFGPPTRAACRSKPTSKSMRHRKIPKILSARPAVCSNHKPSRSK